MKKIISGSLYNTETARLVGEWDNGEGYGKFTRADEDLYQTRSGKYFIHGRGGAMTTYAEHCGNSTSGSEKIIPLTASEAREWAEEKLTADEYAAEFGEPDEAAGDEKRQFPVQLRQSTIDLLKKQKAETGMTYGGLVELAVTEIFKV